MTRPMPSLMHLFAALLSSVMVLSVCTRLGPDFQQPAELWTKEWRSPAIKQASRRQLTPDFRQWWLVFNDPLLDRLIAESDAHNSSLRIAGLRVMEARAQLGIAQSQRYPQLQQASADTLYAHRNQYGGRNPQNSDFWQYSAVFDVGWELDFWGRFSRAIESSDAMGLFILVTLYSCLVVQRLEQRRWPVPQPAEVV